MAKTANPKLDYQQATTWGRQVLLSLWRYVRIMGLLVLVWHLISGIVANPVILPSPFASFDALRAQFASGSLPREIMISLNRLAVGYLAGSLSGILVGTVIGMSIIGRRLFYPLVEILRPISPIAWIPLAVFIFGFGGTLPVFIISYGVFFPFVLNTAAGVESVPRRLIEAAQTLGMSRWVILREVVLPAALPNIMVGARIGAGTAWMSLIAAELVGAPNGLGYYISWNRHILLTRNVLAGMIVIGILGYVTDMLIRRLTRWVLPWAR
jgi:ABC-type nitrate/sulfonate/bicarbonate transport system permease component